MLQIWQTVQSRGRQWAPQDLLCTLKLTKLKLVFTSRMSWQSARADLATWDLAPTITRMTPTSPGWWESLSMRSLEHRCTHRTKTMTRDGSFLSVPGGTTLVPCSSGGQPPRTCFLGTSSSLTHYQLPWNIASRWDMGTTSSIRTRGGIPRRAILTISSGRDNPSQRTSRPTHMTEIEHFSITN